MHAVIIRISLDPGRADEATQALHVAVVPAAKASAGFRAGYWARSDDQAGGASVEVFDSEANARAFVDQIVLPSGSPVSIDSVEVMEVVASA